MLQQSDEALDFFRHHARYSADVGRSAARWQLPPPNPVDGLVSQRMGQKGQVVPLPHVGGSHLVGHQLDKVDTSGQTSTQAATRFEPSGKLDPKGLGPKWLQKAFVIVTFAWKFGETCQRTW